MRKIRNTITKLLLLSPALLQAENSKIDVRSRQGCGSPHFWYRIDKKQASNFARRGETKDMTFVCSTEKMNNLYADDTECLVTCPSGYKATDSHIFCSCLRATGQRRTNCRWMPRRRYTPMKCVPDHGTRDTFDLQSALIFNLLPVPQPSKDKVSPLEGVQLSQIREIDELEFELFNQPTLLGAGIGGVQNSAAGMSLDPFVQMPTITVTDERDDDDIASHIGDDVVYTRNQAKNLRKNGFTIPSYRVLPLTTEKSGKRLGHGDRSVVAIGSKMIQNRWTKWKDANGAYIVPFYFSSSFPGSAETMKTIKTHIEWFNTELNQCIKLEEVSNFDFRYNAKIRVIDGNGCWSYIGMTGADPQDLSLGSYCHTKGLALHEFIHAFGFDHEQNRPDRNDHVAMHWDQIRDDKKWNFQILNSEEWEPTGHPYDFQSVMHYSSKNFASDGVGPTMTKKINGKDTGVEIQAQRDRPSTIDIQQICSTYNCAENCGHKMASCDNGQKIFAHRFCDGLVDCNDESDEKDCTWGCCDEFEIEINGMKFSYKKMGQYKGKDYYYSEKDNKYLFSYFTYWGFSEVLGQPTFYYYTKSEKQCPDELNFLYYSWKVQGSASTKPKCLTKAKPEFEASEEKEVSSSLILGNHPRPTTTETTTTTRRTTTTSRSHCEISEVKPVSGGRWSCSLTKCEAKCDLQGAVPICTESDKLMCLNGQWNFARTSCKCEIPEGTCGAITALKPVWLKRGAEFHCGNNNKVGSECSIVCPTHQLGVNCNNDVQNLFKCQTDLKWSNNVRSSCDCRPKCPSPEKQFEHIAKEIKPIFEKSCSSLFKNGKCKATCPAGTFQRTGKSKFLITQCVCQGNNCKFGKKRTQYVDLFCIKKNHCEKPSQYFTRGLTKQQKSGLQCSGNLQNELFYSAGTECTWSQCPSMQKTVKEGIMCNCDNFGSCNWTSIGDGSTRSTMKTINSSMKLKC